MDTEILKILPDDILREVIRWLPGAEVARLHLSGDTQLSRRMNEKGMVKRYFMDFPRETKILRWPISFMSFPLTHFTFRRASLLAICKFTFTTDHLLLLPETIEFLSLRDTSAESVFIFPSRDVVSKLTSRDMTKCVIHHAGWSYLVIYKIFPKLISLTLEQVFKGNPYFTEDMMALLPPSLTYLSLPWNDQMTFLSASLLQNLSTLLLDHSILLYGLTDLDNGSIRRKPGFSQLALTEPELAGATSSFSSFPSLSPSLTKLSLALNGSITSGDVAKYLPKALLSLKTVIDLSLPYSAAFCSFLPSRLTRLSEIVMHRHHPTLPTLPATLTCLGISFGYNPPTIPNYPSTLQHLRIRLGIMTESALRALPSSLVRLCVYIRKFGDFPIDAFLNLQPQCLPNLHTLELRKSLYGRSKDIHKRCSVTDLKNPEYRNTIADAFS